MAKNFAKANTTKIISDVAMVSKTSANVATIKMIHTDNLVDYPKNHEDINNTIDLENSIRELGFTDPIEVTAFGMEDGKYMIVSGHRRRAAGVKVGLDTFPCIVRNFSNENEVRNYVLLANSQRDSSKDPLLYCARYKMHEEYLRESNFEGNVREEIAKRLGISVQQADRYNQFNKIILPVWDMVRAELVGMSSVLGMATHPESEQFEILSMLNEALQKDVRLTREMCDKIIKGYRSGCRTLEEVLNADTIKDIPVIEDKPTYHDSGLPLNSFIDTTPSVSHTPTESSRNDEIRREFDVFGAVLDSMNESPYADERLTPEDYETIEAVAKSGKNEKPISEEDKKLQVAELMVKHLNGLNSCLMKEFDFDNKDKALSFIRSMTGMISMAIEEMADIAARYEGNTELKESLEDIWFTVEKFVG